MAVHSLFAIEVAGEKVFAIEAFGRLFVPMRTLTESTLGMHWVGQAAKLDRLAGRWRVRTFIVVAASGKTSTQPCLRAHRLEAFLWSLRPGRQDVRDRLARIQDGWPEALLRHYGLESSVDGTTAAQIAERTSHPLKQRIAELKIKNARLETERGSIFQGVAKQRWEFQKNKVLQVDDFLAMAALIDEGATPTEVAVATGCSRPTVSRLIHGTLTTKAAQEALEILLARGWKPRSGK